MSEQRTSNPQCGECDDTLESFDKGLLCPDCGAIVKGKRTKQPRRRPKGVHTDTDIADLCRSYAKSMRFLGEGNPDFYDGVADEIERLRKENGALRMRLDQELMRYNPPFVSTSAVAKCTAEAGGLPPFNATGTETPPVHGERRATADAARPQGISAEQIRPADETAAPRYQSCGSFGCKGNHDMANGGKLVEPWPPESETGSHG